MSVRNPELTARQHAAPFDVDAVDALASQGLDARRVHVQSDAFRPWYGALTRGFLDTERTDEQVQASQERLGYRRLTGVYDPTAAVADEPVATIASWLTELSVPGERTAPTYAISSVSVSPTHRRRGIARSLMEGELRTAAALGVPVAALTATEATLYGRYGFAPAAVGAEWTIDTRRAGWLGGAVPGRVDFISREQFRAAAPIVHERVRAVEPGEIIVPDAHWDSFAGTRQDADKASPTRAIQYRDEAGEVRGVATYTIGKRDRGFGEASADVGVFVAETRDAYAALWRFLLELDLVTTVNAGLRGVDEPLRWLVADQRAITVSVRDHQYVRVLDVVAALQARAYPVAARMLLDVSDRLGLADGRYLLACDADGNARVTRVTDAPAGVAVVTLDVRALGAMYLGGTTARVLHGAGLVAADDLDLVDDVFRSRTTPRLSFWY